MTTCNDVGFSNIRLPDSNDLSYLYTYNASIMVFPQEVFIHEFLHSLERDSKENGYTIPALHSNAEHGYTTQPRTGLEAWYQAYMRKTIYDSTTNTNIGLPPEVYSMQPPHKSQFEFPIEVNFNQEPKNVFDEIGNMFGVLVNFFRGQTV